MTVFFFHLTSCFKIHHITTWAAVSFWYPTSHGIAVEGPISPHPCKICYCAHVCACMCVCPYPSYTCTCLRSMLGVFLNHFSTLGFEALSLPEPKQPFLARLAGQHAPGIWLGLQMWVTMAGFLCGCWRSDPKSSCLSSKLSPLPAEPSLQVLVLLGF